MNRALAMVAAAGLLLSPLDGGVHAQEIDIREDGTIAVPPLEVPPSPYLSEAGHQSRIEHILKERSLKGQPVDEFNASLFGARLERTKAAFAVTMKATEIAGIPVLIYEPEEGVAPEHRGKLIINLHGGGFVGCFVECGGLESIPVAAMSGMRVISIDYRIYPEDTFPAASDDVETVYRELLKTVPANRMAIYGCSAGGVLTSQSLARFHEESLPQPAAAAILCAGGGSEFVGDSMFTGMILGDGEMPRPPADEPDGYMSTAGEGDPTANPIRDAATLASFPPTLVALGSRDFAMSSATFLHRQLVGQGVDARLHIWDGGRHAFFYDIRVPEALEVFALVAGFLTDHLASASDE